MRKISYIMALAVLAIGLIGCGNNEAINRDIDTNNEFRNVANRGVDPFPYNVANNGNTYDSWDGTPSKYYNRTNMTNKAFDGNHDHEDNPEISATVTEINSDKYPHTKAILIQEAKYKFVEDKNIDPKQIGENIRQQVDKSIREFANDLPRSGNREFWDNDKRGTKQQQAQTPTKQPPPTQAPNTGGQKQAKVNQPQAPTNNATQKNNQQATTPKQDTQQNATTGISEFARKVIDLTNEQRKANGLSALQADTALSNVALKKSQDMVQNNYFSHTSPTYGSPFDMMRDFGIQYKTAGENIAQGQTTPEQVVNAWMNSEGHRANILNKNFTHIGVGYDPNGHHWTQMFIGK